MMHDQELVIKFIAIMICLLLFSSCRSHTDTQVSNTNAEVSSSERQLELPSEAADNFQGDSFAALRTALQTATQEESNDLMTLFFRYYYSGPHFWELSMLPDFDVDHAPDWDDLTLYVFVNTDKADDLLITREAFAETIKKYLNELTYTDQSSRYLTYGNGVYAPLPGDSMWSGFYRLTDIAVDEENIYTASFDMMTFSESEYSDNYKDLQPNMKTLRDAAGVTSYEDMGYGVLDNTILSIYTRDDYNEILEMTQNTKITFKLSKNEDYPIIYFSCKTVTFAESKKEAGICQPLFSDYFSLMCR